MSNILLHDFKVCDTKEGVYDFICLHFNLKLSNEVISVYFVIGLRTWSKTRVCDKYIYIMYRKRPKEYFFIFLTENTI